VRWAADERRPQPEGRLPLPGFFMFWAAETVSEFGTHVTTIALQVLVVLTLGGAAFEVGRLAPHEDSN
jgi:hypothetical protein